MPTLHLLGTGAAFSGPDRTTTMLAFADTANTLLVDCGADAVQRLLAAEIDLNTLSGLIVTHEHPDHVGGFPLFMERIWLSGRRKPIPVYGIGPAIDQARRAFEVYNTRAWEGLPVVQWREVAHTEMAPVLNDGVWEVTASPVVHPVPIIGIRVRHIASGTTVAYSCDTEPTDNMVRLAQGAEILVHEAAGEGKGHSSARQAAEIAVRAGVNTLVCVHVPGGDLSRELEAARQVFAQTYIGEDLERWTF